MCGWILLWTTKCRSSAFLRIAFFHLLFYHEIKIHFRHLKILAYPSKLVYSESIKMCDGEFSSNEFLNVISVKSEVVVNQIMVGLLLLIFAFLRWICEERVDIIILLPGELSGRRKNAASSSHRAEKAFLFFHVMFISRSQKCANIRKFIKSSASFSSKFVFKLN